MGRLGELAVLSGPARELAVKVLFAAEQSRDLGASGPREESWVPSRLKPIRACSTLAVPLYH